MSDDSDTNNEAKAYKPHGGSGSLGIFGLVTTHLFFTFLLQTIFAGTFTS